MVALDRPLWRTRLRGNPARPVYAWFHEYLIGLFANLIYVFSRIKAGILSFSGL